MATKKTQRKPATSIATPTIKRTAKTSPPKSKKWLLYGGLGIAAVAAVFGGSKLPFFSKVAAPFLADSAHKVIGAASAALA